MRKTTGLAICVAVAWGLLVTLAASEGVRAAGADELRVCQSGCPYSSLQAAVDAAADGDVIKVASGVYAGVSARAGVTQSVYLSKTVTIRGGYTVTDFQQSRPDTQITLLDAQNQGRVFYIAGAISPTVEGLYLTGGNAQGQRGGMSGEDAGGGVYIAGASPVISASRIFSNTAIVGGGLYLDGSAARLIANLITLNRAAAAGLEGGGGGLCLNLSPAVLEGNSIVSNSARISGGGLLIFESAATLRANSVVSNVAASGCGMYAFASTPVLAANVIGYNRCDEPVSGDHYGGGLYIGASNTTLTGNLIISNSANAGGAAFLSNSDGIWYGNLLLGNVGAWDAGGLNLMSNSNVQLINNVVAENVSGGAPYGAAIVVEGSSPQLIHGTFARNTGGHGAAILVKNYAGDLRSTVFLTNTIIASQTVGISVTVGNTASLQGMLMGANQTNWGGAGTVIHVSFDKTGNPAFVNPSRSDYHITRASAAINSGAATSVTLDLDGDRRLGLPDIGADEWVLNTFVPVVLK
jgi:hypothetical protein